MVDLHIPPLNQNSPIVDDKGRPSTDFLLLMNQLLKTVVESAADDAADAAAAAAAAQADADSAGASAAAAQADVDALEDNEIIAGTGITGGGLLSDPDIDIILADTAVVPDTYGDSTHVPQITVDQQGRLTEVVEVAIAGGGGGGAFALISSVVVSSPVASIDFTAIPDTYTDLFVTGLSRGTDGGVLVVMYIRFNTDTGFNYDGEQIHYFDSGSLVAQYVGQQAGRVTQMACAGAPAGFSTGFTIEIPGYNSPLNKSAIGIFQASAGTGGFSQGAGQYVTNWRGSAAVSDISLIPGSGNFDAGTIVTLYGRG